jgi:hypothetical protein
MYHPTQTSLRGRYRPVFRRHAPLYYHPEKLGSGARTRREARAHSHHTARHYGRWEQDTAREGGIPSPED